MIRNLLLLVTSFFTISAFAAQCPALSDWKVHEAGKNWEMTDSAFDQGWRYNKQNPNLAITTLPPEVTITLEVKSSTVDYELLCHYKRGENELFSIKNKMSDPDPKQLPCSPSCMCVVTPSQPCSWEWLGS